MIYKDGEVEGYNYLTACLHLAHLESVEAICQIPWVSLLIGLKPHFCIPLSQLNLSFSQPMAPHFFCSPFPLFPHTLLLWLTLLKEQRTQWCVPQTLSSGGKPCSPVTLFCGISLTLGPLGRKGLHRRRGEVRKGKECKSQDARARV